MQDRASFSINRTDISVSRSRQLDMAVPASKISSLSSGEFVGMVADNPDEKIDLKTFHAQIINDHDALKKEESAYEPIPVIRKVDPSMINRNYLQIKQEVQHIADSEIERMIQDPSLSYLLIKK